MRRSPALLLAAAGAAFGILASSAAAAPSRALHIAGVDTAAALPSALIGINPTGTSSAMYLCVQADGVPVAW